MKDLEKTQADANPTENENLNKDERNGFESDFDLDHTLTDAPVMEQDYFTFNIQDIIKAVNEHEAAASGPELESEIEFGLESEVDPEQELEVEAEHEPTPEHEPESEPEVKLEPEDVDLEPESDPEPEAEEESVPEVESETEVEPEPTSEIEADPDSELEVEQEEEPELEHELETEPEPENELETETATEAEPEPEHKSDKKPGKKIDVKDPKNKRLILTDAILLLIVIASIVGGLVAANALVNKANAAKSEKITAVQENVKEVDLAESLRAYAADEVLEQMQVPTYTLDQLYALDLRTKTGFTEEDLKIITTCGLKGCEKAFVKAEETYGVNSIFLISIASLESAYGTQMFRPNNMFGYGRTGFSSKSECIMTVAKGLGTRYLNPGGSLYGGSPTLKGVNKRYAANPKWYYKVGKYMQRYYNELAAAKNGNLEKFE